MSLEEQIIKKEEIELSNKKDHLYNWIWSDGTEMKKSKVKQNQLLMEFTRNHPPLMKRESTLDDICKKTNNPYFSKNNYVDDITIQQQFLIPKNSNFEERQ